MTHLVLLPGLDGTDVLLGPLRAALPATISAHVVEYERGAADYAALLPSVRAELARYAECFVLGWSFSGPLALQLAADPPPNLRGVILGATFATSPWPCGRFLALLVCTPLAALAPIASMALGTASGELGAQLSRDKRTALARVPAATLAARMRSVLRVDVRVAARACRVPALALVSSRDLVVPFWNARRLSRTVPALHTERLRGAHLALYTHAVEASRHISAFMAHQNECV